MKCPECGQWNRASLPRCVKCGCELNHESDAPAWRGKLKDDQRGKEYIRVDEFGDATSVPDRRDVLATEMQELKKRKDEGSKQLRRLRQESAKRGAAPSAMPMRTTPDKDTVFHVQDDPRTTVRIVRGSGSSGPQHHVEPGASTPWQSYSRTYDPLVDEFAKEQVYPERSFETERIQFTSRISALRRIIRILTLVLILGVVGVGAFVGVNYYQQHRAANSLQNRASITASILDDAAAHTILIPGTDGQQIYIKELHTSYMVTGGFATVEVADHTWYSDLAVVDQETMTVSLSPYVKTASGQQKPLEQISYDISIPLSPITLDSPDSLRSEVSVAMYPLKFTVRPGSKVIINGDNVSDTVNADTGELTYNATVQPIGDNVFTVAVTSQHCRTNTLEVVLYREPQEIPLDLSADTFTSTSLDSIEIRATTIPGATIKVHSPHSDLKITSLDTTGEFSFMATFDHIGYNTITITASVPGKKTSKVDYTVYYVPNIDVYSRKAWPLYESEYAELLSNIKTRSERSQVYVAEGTVAYEVSSKPQMVVIYTSKDGKSQPVLLENQSKTKWVVGEAYKIYADAYGTYDNMPWLVARYTYPK
ncbi:MAG: hypothetical protein E7333_02230 [Clostridiales bacterium]|nr:hypothetical protein [Clostridiales bacterium]